MKIQSGLGNPSAHFQSLEQNNRQVIVNRHSKSEELVPNKSDTSVRGMQTERSDFTLYLQ